MGVHLLPASNSSENSPNLGVSYPPQEPSPHGDEIRCLLYMPYRAGCHPVLPHRDGTNFTPWYGEAMTYGNTTQHFHPVVPCAYVLTAMTVYVIVPISCTCQFVHTRLASNGVDTFR